MFAITERVSRDDNVPTDDDDQQIGNPHDNGRASDFAERRDPHCHRDEAVQWGDLGLA